MVFIMVRQETKHKTTRKVQVIQVNILCDGKAGSALDLTAWCAGEGLGRPLRAAPVRHGLMGVDCFFEESFLFGRS